jgi:hypothetical protein
MKNRFQIFWVLLVGFCFCNLSNINAQQLNDFLWKNRVIIINESYQNFDTADLQQNSFFKYKEELDERKLVILKFDGKRMSQVYPHINKHFTDLARDFKIGQDDSILLIGLDGGVKLRRKDFISPKSIFDLIDSMPMRQSEMRFKKK